MLQQPHAAPRRHLLYIPLSCGLLLLAATLLAAPQAKQEDPAAKLKSVEAKVALSLYKIAHDRARALYTKEEEPARKKLLLSLEVAREKAAKANQAEDAQLIREIRKNYETMTEPVPIDTTPQAPQTIRIISAFYGQNVSWIDVTDKVQALAAGKPAWTATVDTDDLGDPIPGWTGTRSLIVRYAIGPKVAFKVAYQNKVITLN